MNELIEYAKLEEFLKKKLERKMLDEQKIESLVESVERAKKVGVDNFRELSKKQSKKKRK